MTAISAPVDWVEAVSQLRLSQPFDRRLQELMDRNIEGELSAAERAELESLVEMSERLSLVRAEAFTSSMSFPNRAEGRQRSKISHGRAQLAISTKQIAFRSKTV